MAIKKSQLYYSLWQSCDELRGGMDASQYKDYVLTLLFMKYVSDKYAGKSDAVIEVPKGGSFADMVKLKGDKEIGDKINKVIGALAKANDLDFLMPGRSADFNDEDKLGRGKDMQDRRVAGNNRGFQSARALALGGGESEAYMALLGLLRFASFARDHWDERASTE